jgi:hypothetical protein
LEPAIICDTPAPPAPPLISEPFNNNIPLLTVKKFWTPRKGSIRFKLETVRNPVLPWNATKELKYPNEPRPLFVDTNCESKKLVLIKLRRFGVETKLRRLSVETRFRRLGVETKLRRLGVETNPRIEDTYPNVPRPETVDCNRVSKNEVLTRFMRLGLETKLRRLGEETTLSRLGVLTKFKRLGVETKLRRLGVLTKFKRLGEDTNPLREEIYPKVARPATVDCNRVSKNDVLTRFKRLGVETKLRRLGVETKFKRLGVEIRFKRLGVETKPRNDSDETYPTVPRPETVDCRFSRVSVPLPTDPRAVEKEDKAP